jgi:GTP-binding protein Era
MSEVTKFGYLALIGLPNAGKSTLLNACLGQKIAGVSAKPQTTRNRIVGVLHRDQVQIALLDTPGLQHKSPKAGVALARQMNKEARGAFNEADVVAYLVDSKRGLVEEDWAHIKQIAADCKGKLYLVLAKEDKLDKTSRAELRQRVAHEVRSQMAGHDVAILSLSAKVKASVDQFIELVSTHLPEGPHLFPSDATTDRPPEFVCGELIREQLFRCLGQELPYATAVKIDAISEQGQHKNVLATVYVPKEAHKGMVIGKGGSKLKEIGSLARVSLERYFGQKVYLELFVKVQEGWLDRDNLVHELVGPFYTDD